MGGRFRAREEVRLTLELRRADKDKISKPPRSSGPRVYPPTEKQVDILIEVRRKGGTQRSIRGIALAVGASCPTVDNCFRRGWLENPKCPRLTYAGHEVVREPLMLRSGERSQTNERPRSLESE